MPFEADPPLPVDPDAVLALAIPLERLIPITGEHPQCCQAIGGIQDAEALFGLAGERLELPNELPVEQSFCT